MSLPIASAWMATADAVHDAAGTRFGAELVATVVHGSAALGGWVPGSSDVDMLLVCRTAIDRTRLDEFAGEVAVLAASRTLAIELSIITQALAEQPCAPWPFLLHVNAPAGPASSARVVFDTGAGDPDLLMHIAVCREHGLRVGAQHPAADIRGLFGNPGRPQVLRYLRTELEWGLREAPQKYAVLNACRAVRYVDDAATVSKLAGGRWAVERMPPYADVIRRALEEQEHGLPSAPPGHEAARLVREVLTIIDAAMRTEGDL